MVCLCDFQTCVPLRARAFCVRVRQRARNIAAGRFSVFDARRTYHQRYHIMLRASITLAQHRIKQIIMLLEAE